MKIVLISPLPVYHRIPQPFWIPLGLAFMASILRRDNHTVSIFDRHAMQSKVGIDRNKMNAIMLEHIQRFKPDVIGLQTISPLIYDSVECVELIRRIYSGSLIAGGHHATALPELTLRKIPELNGVVTQEGEIPISRIASGENPENIAGVWWRKDTHSIAHTPSQQNQELDSLPFPAFDLLDMNYYTSPNINAINGRYISSVSMLTSRGCVNRCEFCSESLAYGKGVRFHSTEYVIEWMKSVLTNYPVEGIYFHDNDFLINKNRAMDICENIISHGFHTKIKWAIQARADHISADILKLLKQAGCVLIEIGAESSLQDQLNNMKKSSTVNSNERAFALCRQAGIATHAYMMAGFKGEQISHLENKLRWLKKNRPNSFGFHPLMIHPGTALYEKLGSRFFENSDWNRHTVEDYYSKDHLSDISNEEWMRWTHRRLLPYQIWHSALHFFKKNPPGKIVLFFIAKRKRMIDYFMLFIKAFVRYGFKTKDSTNSQANE